MDRINKKKKNKRGKEGLTNTKYRGINWSKFLLNIEVEGARNDKK